MTTQLLRQEIVQHVRELPDEAILDLVRGKLRVADRSDTARRRPRAPEPPIAGELVALRTSIEAAVARLDQAGTIDGAALTLARQEIVRLAEQVAVVTHASAGVTARCQAAEKNLEAEARARCGLATTLGEAETEVAKLQTLAMEASLARSQFAELRLQTEGRSLVELVNELEQLRQNALTTHEESCSSWLADAREKGAEIKALKAQLTDLTAELQETNGAAGLLLQGRDAEVAKLKAEINALHEVVSARNADLAARPAAPVASTFPNAGAWKALAKEMKGRWVFAKGLLAANAKGPSRANLVVPTDFEAREKLRIANGHFERAAARQEAEDAPDDAEPADDDGGEEESMRAPLAKKAAPKAGASSRRRAPDAPTNPKMMRKRVYIAAKYEIEGVKRTVAEIVEKYGVTEMAVRQRIKRGTLSGLPTSNGKRGPDRAKRA